VNAGDGAREAIAMNPYDGNDDAGFGPDEDFDADMITMNPPRWQRWRDGRSRPVAVAGVAIAALAGGAGIGYAATHSLASSGAPDTAAVAAAAAPTTSPSAAPVPRHPAGRGWHAFGGGFPGAGFGIGIGGAGGVVHGQLTVPKSGGGYQTEDLQRGTVTAVTSGSISVRSADGFTATYVVSGKTLVDAQAAGIGSVKKGDTVFVTATVSGSTATAVSVLDQTAIKAGRAAFGFPGRPTNLPNLPKAPATPNA
jgi:hypothetical protein